MNQYSLDNIAASELAQFAEEHSLSANDLISVAIGVAAGKATPMEETGRTNLVQV